MNPPQGYLLDTNIVLHATRSESPVISEVTVAEMWAFARSWGPKRREQLQHMMDDLLVLPISDPRIHRRWSELYSYARDNGLAIRHDHNDVWIAATAHVAGLRLLSADSAAFLPLRGSVWVDVVVVDAKTGIILP